MTIEDAFAVGCSDGVETHAERQLDPWRKPKTPAAERFIDLVSQMLEDHETRCGLRKRKRKAKDNDTFRRVLSALISDLAVSALAEEGRSLRVYRSNGKLN